MVEENPKADNEALFTHFNRYVDLADEAIIESIKRYYFDNNIRSLLTPEPLPQSVRRQRSALAESIEEKIISKIEERAKILLLETMMPNGKVLRDCTGQECRKMGGWLAEIGAKLKPSELVGKKFTEDQLQSHWRRKYDPKA